MNKPITSRDPRKAAIVHALKKASNCRRITTVTQVGQDQFSGTCMWPNAGESITGTVTVTWTPFLPKPTAADVQQAYEDAMNR